MSLFEINYQSYIDTIQKHLSPDLLKSIYREENKKNPMFGHCYVATEVLYYMLNDFKRYVPARGRDTEGIVHWWLEDKSNGEIIDVTKEQYYSQGKEPPYEKGKRCGFLTNTPSKRAVTVLSRINGKG